MRRHGPPENVGKVGRDVMTGIWGMSKITLMKFLLILLVFNLKINY